MHQTVNLTVAVKLTIPLSYARYTVDMYIGHVQYTECAGEGVGMAGQGAPFAT